MKMEINYKLPNGEVIKHIFTGLMAYLHHAVIMDLVVTLLDRLGGYTNNEIKKELIIVSLNKLNEVVNSQMIDHFLTGYDRIEIANLINKDNHESAI